MIKKRVVLPIIAAGLLVVTTMLTLGGSSVQAHGGGHQGGCKGFGELVSTQLAGPEFGQFHRLFSPSAPGANADMVKNDGHALCN